MTLIFDDQRDISHTHVFIIGIGRYPYLNGGENGPRANFDIAASLQQLSSPACSAAAMYEMAVQFHKNNNWIKPLGSIELLISPLSDQNILPGVQYSPATMKNIEESYWKWRGRCDESKDNVAIFYFCGHGIEKIEQYLLAEDFAGHPHNPWSNFLGIDSLRRAFHRCQAETQLFFIDSCRQITAEMLESMLPTNMIEIPNIRDSTCRYDLTQKASAPLGAAFGVINQPSYFTSTLIEALKGGLAKNNGGNWSVSTGDLGGYFNRLLRNGMQEEGFEQSCHTTMNDYTEIIQLHAPPLVQFKINCDPSEAESIASLEYQEVVSKQSDKHDSPGPWTVTVPAGIYQLEAQFKCGKYPKSTAWASVTPPSTNVKINCHGSSQ